MHRTCLATGPPDTVSLPNMGQNRRAQDRERAARAVVRRTERVQVILPADELAAIEDFRFQARMPSRSAAIRELLRRGMARASRAGRA